MTAPHGPIDALLAELPASRGGLTSDEARRRLDAAGPNEPARAPRTAGFVQILCLLANPLVIILLIASAASAILGERVNGERVNASIIVLMVVLSVVLNFVQTYRSHRVAERLRDAVAPTATVLRDGTWREIRRRDLVPGDIVRLARARERRVPEDRRDPVRLRAPAPLRRRRERRRAPADHEGGSGGRHRPLHRLRDRRAPGPAR